MFEAYNGAGKESGLEIWVIQNFEPVAYPKNDYGKFYSGDSYVILNTKESHGSFSWNIHFWLGSETSQDESGTAAIVAVQLDEQLGGVPIQYREVQEHESELFLSYFKNGVRYLPGGVNSGFGHVDRDNFEKRLFQIKGKRNIRVKQVKLDVKSMNKGDCFILDIGSEIYVYVGGKSSRIERMRATGAANQIRDQDHGGRPSVIIVDSFSSQDEINTFFSELGSGSPSEVPNEDVGGDDEQFECGEVKSVTLHRVSDSSGKLEIQKVGEKPLLHNLLDTSDCFILDTRNANLFVWIGKSCTKDEKVSAMKKAQEFVKINNYPAWTRVQRVVEGAEPAAFREYFESWSDGSESALFHARLLFNGKVRYEHIYNFTQEDLDQDDVMVLDTTKTIFVWIGSGATDDEEEQVAKQLPQLLRRINRDNSPVVTIKQGKEVKEFTAAFPSWK